MEFFEGVTRRHGALAGIGIAAFGPVDLDTRSPTWGRILATPKPGWSDVSLAAPLERFGCPIAVDTDVSAAALAEARLGAGAGLGSLAYVTVGTGIGGGVFVADRTLKGLLHPEMGHIRVKRDPRDADFAGVCPFHGDCLEGLASGPAVVARWNTRADCLPEMHPAREILGDNPQRPRRPPPPVPRITGRRQLHQPHPVREPPCHPLSHRAGQPGLAHPARPGHRDQPALTQQARHLAHRPGPADKTRQHSRETMHATTPSRPLRPALSRPGPGPARRRPVGTAAPADPGPSAGTRPHPPA